MAAKKLTDLIAATLADCDYTTVKSLEMLLTERSTAFSLDSAFDELQAKAVRASKSCTLNNIEHECARVVSGVAKLKGLSKDNGHGVIEAFFD